VAVDPEELRIRAQEWGRSFLLQAPWEPLTERLSLILVAPPPESGLAYSPLAATMWLLLDRPSIGSLPEGLRHPLMTNGVAIERHRATASTPAVEIAVRTVEAIEHQLESMGRRDLELRWTLTHAVPISDRLRRLETLSQKSRLLPPDGLERAVRGLWLDAYAASRGLWPLTEDPRQALPAGGELASALLRLACLLDEGSYPPIDWLRSAAAPTRIGMRLGGWLDDLTAALSGDEVAARRTVHANEQALEEVRQIIRERYADRDWLRDPAGYELRARR